VKADAGDAAVLETWLAGMGRDPTVEALAEDVGQMLEARGDSSRLIEVLRNRLTHLDAPEDRLPVLRKCARTIEESGGEAKELNQCLEEILAHNPNDAGAHMSLGRMKAVDGRVPAALEHYECVARVSDEDSVLVESFTALGRLRGERLGDYASAIEEFRKALSLDGGEAALDGLADSYLGAGQAELGLMAYEKLHKTAVATDWKVRAVFGQARALVLLKRNAEALRRLEGLNEVEWNQEMVAGAARMLLAVGQALDAELRQKLLELGIEVEG
jgi:tetratricopeptide (TPR) repeat protein